jgi:hypothetical protein
MYLSRTVGTATTNTGDTGDGTTGTPRFGGCLMTSLFADGVSLPLVLGHALCAFQLDLAAEYILALTVDLSYDIKPNGCCQYRWERQRGRRLCLWS